MSEYEIFCSARRARYSCCLVLQIFTLQTLLDSTNSYQESLAFEHVNHMKEGVEKNQFFFLGLCPKLWVGGGQKF